MLICSVPNGTEWQPNVRGLPRIRTAHVAKGTVRLELHRISSASHPEWTIYRTLRDVVRPRLTASLLPNCNATFSINRVAGTRRRECCLITGRNEERDTEALFGTDCWDEIVADKNVDVAIVLISKLTNIYRY